MRVLASAFLWLEVFFSGAAFGLLVARRFCSRAGFGFLRLIRSGSGAAFRRARQAAGETS